jgi:isopentenyldiphosphate isomerase
MIVEP